MASVELLQKILDAYYEAEFSEPCDQEAKTNALDSLLEEATKDSPHSKLGLVEAIGERYREYKRKRKRQEGIPTQVVEGKMPDILPPK